MEIEDDVHVSMLDEKYKDIEEFNNLEAIFNSENVNEEIRANVRRLKLKFNEIKTSFASHIRVNKEKTRKQLKEMKNADKEILNLKQHIQITHNKIIKKQNTETMQISSAPGNLLLWENMTTLNKANYEAVNQLKIKSALLEDYHIYIANLQARIAYVENRCVGLFAQLDGANDTCALQIEQNEVLVANAKILENLITHQKEQYESQIGPLKERAKTLDDRIANLLVHHKQREDELMQQVSELSSTRATLLDDTQPSSDAAPTVGKSTLLATPPEFVSPRVARLWEMKPKRVSTSHVAPTVRKSSLWEIQPDSVSPSHVAPTVRESSLWEIQPDSVSPSLVAPTVRKSTLWESQPECVSHSLAAPTARESNLWDIQSKCTSTSHTAPTVETSTLLETQPRHASTSHPPPTNRKSKSKSKSSATSDRTLCKEMPKQVAKLLKEIEGLQSQLEKTAKRASKLEALNQINLADIHFKTAVIKDLYNDIHNCNMSGDRKCQEITRLEKELAESLQSQKNLKELLNTIRHSVRLTISECSEKIKKLEEVNNTLLMDKLKLQQNRGQQPFDETYTLQIDTLKQENNALTLKMQLLEAKLKTAEDNFEIEKTGHLKSLEANNSLETQIYLLERRLLSIESNTETVKCTNMNPLDRKSECTIKIQLLETNLKAAEEKLQSEKNAHSKSVEKKKSLMIKMQIMETKLKAAEEELGTEKKAHKKSRERKNTLAEKMEILEAKLKTAKNNIEIEKNAQLKSVQSLEEDKQKVIYKLAESETENQILVEYIRVQEVERCNENATSRKFKQRLRTAIGHILKHVEQVENIFGQQQHATEPELSKILSKIKTTLVNIVNALVEQIPAPTTTETSQVTQVKENDLMQLKLKIAVLETKYNEASSELRAIKVKCGCGAFESTMELTKTKESNKDCSSCMGLVERIRILEQQIAGTADETETLKTRCEDQTKRINELERQNQDQKQAAYSTRYMAVLKNENAALLNKCNKMEKALDEVKSQLPSDSKAKGRSKKR